MPAVLAAFNMRHNEGKFYLLPGVALFPLAGVLGELAVPQLVGLDYAGVREILHDNVEWWQVLKAAVGCLDRKSVV